jgi:hypothetical protein
MNLDESAVESKTSAEYVDIEVAVLKVISKDFPSLFVCVCSLCG